VYGCADRLSSDMPTVTCQRAGERLPMQSENASEEGVRMRGVH
jgi:hypothetical protein